MEKHSPRETRGEGRFRTTHVVGSRKDVLAKIPKEKIKKKFSFGTVSFPAAPYTLLKFGTTNINKADWENYQALPEIVKQQFTPKTRMERGVIFQDIVMDFDGAPSLSMDDHYRQFGKIDNVYFWTKIEELRGIFLNAKQLPFDIFHGGYNIMIKKTSEDTWLPIIIDFKRLGKRSYLFQPQLLLNSEMRKKFLRRFKRFEDKYRA